jgi:anti-sigma regulatory factor (Ser/Thr protein kinase)
MLKKSFLEKEFIAKLTILSDKEFIQQAQNFVISYSKYFGFNDKELIQIELLVEEALLSTIENSFPDEVLENIDIILSYKPGKFIISIHDKGMPLDLNLLETSENSFMSVLLMKNFADEFQFINLGKSGKRFELIKYVNTDELSSEFQEKTEIPEEVEEVTDPNDITEISLINPNDVPQLSRLAFKSYGYTYISIFYYPEKIKELLERGLLVSAVCFNREREIVSNLCLVFEHPGDKVADSGAAMVDPRYRGHNLFKRMKVFLSDYAKEKGMYGIYSEAVTIHPYTQLGNISLGAKATGIMLAFVKEITSFKKISKERIDQRQAVVLYYLKTNQEPHRKIFINEKFYDILCKIYNNLELDREIIKIDSSIIFNSLVENSTYSTSVKSDLNIAIIRIETIGEDAFQIIKAQLKHFCVKKIETIYLELPLSDSNTGVLTKEANKMGFLFSGIIPEFCDGDIIKLQFLNNVIVDPEKICLAGDLSKEILENIMQDYK